MPEYSAVAGVPGEIETEIVDFQKPATPERGVGVRCGAAAEVLGWQAEHLLIVGYTVRLPPAQFYQVMDAAFFKPGAQAHGNTKAQVCPEAPVQLAHGCFVQVVVVIV